jgi:transposase
MKEITTLGVDLAKSGFTVHGVDVRGRTVMRRSVRRETLMELVVGLPPCLIGMEACGGAHEWARKFQDHGHRVGIMMARFVAPYRKSSKNDGNDAEAICEAAARPNMRFVPVKSAEQQAILSRHRVRQGFIEQRTATINRIRGLLAEFGVCGGGRNRTGVDGFAVCGITAVRRTPPSDTAMLRCGELRCKSALSSCHV